MQSLNALILSHTQLVMRVQMHATTNQYKPEMFHPINRALVRTCSRQGQQRQQAAHGHQRPHFGCKGPSLLLPEIYIPGLKVRGHDGGGGAQQLLRYQPLCVRAAVPIRNVERRGKLGEAGWSSCAPSVQHHGAAAFSCCGPTSQRT